MKFKGELNPLIQQIVEKCDLILRNPERLAALERTGLMDSPADPAFDRLARLAACVLNVPLTIISLVSDRKQFFKASYGLPAPMDIEREIPIDGSICRYTLHGEPIISSDASTDPLLKFHPATVPWKIGAFVALPIITEDGHVLGAFCAVDFQARNWKDIDIEVMRELTHSVMTEINLRNQINELKLERKLRETFVNALSHDLRTPMTSARMSAQMIQRKSQSKELNVLTDRIVASVDRADLMIRNLLDANFLKAGDKIPLTVEPCDLSDLAGAVTRDLRVVYGPRLRMSYEGFHFLGKWDPSGVQRIIENLISNAVKYGSSSTSILVRLKDEGDWVEISVNNRGGLLSLKDQSGLFTLFHRTESAMCGGQLGWGIGLSLVKGIAEAHGGTVRLESTTDLGTTFFVQLPKNT